MSHNKSVTSAQISGKLLHWYDANARVLPWRIPPPRVALACCPTPIMFGFPK